MADFDLALALSLQEQFDKELQSDTDGPGPSRIVPFSEANPRGPGRSVVDEHWELVDPTPNIHDLFVEFDAMFFRGALVGSGVEVNWSSRMSLCAGLCKYEGQGGLCSIRLSQPLLKLRSRKNLVETLLHEMIHAFLFVADRNTDHDAHGPKFLSHMHRINSATGACISVYHSFHDEVAECRGHWWRCDGSCRDRPPYFGYVKRAMNRAPHPRDRWWAEHQASCGGTFTKLKEPDGYGGLKRAKGNDKGGAAVGQNAGGQTAVAKSGSGKGKGGKTTTGTKGEKNVVKIDDLFREGGKSTGQKPLDASLSDHNSISTTESEEERLRRPTDGASTPGEPSCCREEAELLSSVGAGSLRDKMLAAAEKRLQANRERGRSGSNKTPVCLSNHRTTAQPSSIGSQDFGLETKSLRDSESGLSVDGYPAQKKLKLSPKKPSVVLDLTSPISELPRDPSPRLVNSVPSCEVIQAGSSHDDPRRQRPRTRQASVIDLSELDDASLDISSVANSTHCSSGVRINIDEAIFGTVDVTDVAIFGTVDVTDVDLDPETRAGSDNVTLVTSEDKTCPVCGRSGIPAAIINSHVTLCLEEEEEHQLVLE